MEDLRKNFVEQFANTQEDPAARDFGMFYLKENNNIFIRNKGRMK